jgi:outer membrane protein OmpA-like peptidoglycan-associated protein
LELAKRAYAVAETGNTTYDNAKGYYIDVINACPTYNADAYYYLGVIYYGDKQDEKALEYFTKFIQFKSENDWAYSGDHAKKMADVKSVLEELEFNVNYFKNPVPFSPQIVNLVSSVNDEYLPMISPDNEMLFFTRKLDRKNLGDITSNVVEEITLATRKDMDSPFDAGVPLPKPFNVGSNYGGVTISVDNKEMYICSCAPIKTKDNQTYNNCDIFVTHYEMYYDSKDHKAYRWGELVNLGPNINSETEWEATPSLSGDGKTLYFSKMGKNTRGEDIYYSTRDEEGNWTKAKPLTAVNSAGGDKAPFMHSDSKTLYFISQVDVMNGRYGAGKYDIFYTKQDEKGKWTNPKNIGYPINTEYDEYGLIVAADGHWAYIASGRQSEKKGGQDIYRFELPTEARPEKVIIVKGVVKDDNGQPVAEAKVEITNATTKEKIEVNVNKDDGKYATVVSVKENDDVVVAVKKPEHMVETKYFKITEDSKPVVNETLKVKEIKVNEPYVINDILFATASFELTDQSKAILDKFVDFLKDNPTFKAAIHGHTDDVGNDEKNMTLSSDRANAVKEYMISSGIEASRLSSKGFGETKFKVKNDSEENRALNRRTEFLVTGK